VLLSAVGKNLPGVSSRDLNLGLPNYQLTTLHPINWATLCIMIYSWFRLFVEKILWMTIADCHLLGQSASGINFSDNSRRSPLLDVEVKPQDWKNSLSVILSFFSFSDLGQESLTSGRYNNSILLPSYGLRFQQLKTVKKYWTSSTLREAEPSSHSPLPPPLPMAAQSRLCILLGMTVNFEHVTHKLIQISKKIFNESSPIHALNGGQILYL
jgi:hypothetical protein